MTLTAPSGYGRSSRPRATSRRPPAGEREALKAGLDATGIPRAAYGQIRPAKAQRDGQGSRATACAGDRGSAWCRASASAELSRAWPATAPRCARSGPSAWACRSVLGVVGQRAVPELVQGRAAGGGLEDGLGLLVAQPGVPGRVQVGRRELHPGPALGDEHRPGLAALEQPRRGLAVLVCRTITSTAPPLRARARRFARSRSSTSRPSTSAERAAVSYSIRHRVRSRRLTSSRVRSCSDVAADSARERSGGGVRRRSIREGSAVIQPCCSQYAAADRMASSATFQVAGARSPHCLTKPGGEPLGADLARRRCRCRTRRRPGGGSGRRRGGCPPARPRPGWRGRRLRRGRGWRRRRPGRCGALYPRADTIRENVIFSLIGDDML